jgi:hypothetical protein
MKKVIKYAEGLLLVLWCIKVAYDLTSFSFDPQWVSSISNELKSIDRNFSSWVVYAPVIVRTLSGFLVVIVYGLLLFPSFLRNRNFGKLLFWSLFFWLFYILSLLVASYLWGMHPVYQSQIIPSDNGQIKWLALLGECIEAAGYFFSILILYAVLRLVVLNESEGARLRQILGSLSQPFLFCLFFQVAVLLFITTADGGGDWLSWFTVLTPFACFFFLLHRYWLWPSYLVLGRYRAYAYIQLFLAFYCIITAANWVNMLYLFSNRFFFVFGVLSAVVLLGIFPLIYLYFYAMRHRLALEARYEQAQADLQSLRSHIHPHFLFNSLNTVYGLALREKAQATAEAIQQLSDITRYLMDIQLKPLVSFAEELNYLGQYVSMQKTRFVASDDIDIRFEVNTSLAPDVLIPPLLLLPLIENAFKYGISHDRPSWVHIRLEMQHNDLFFDVRNSTHVQKGIVHGQGTGLENLRRRLALLFPGRHTLNTTYGEGSFTASLSIKKFIT